MHNFFIITKYYYLLSQSQFIGEIWNVILQNNVFIELFK